MIGIVQAIGLLEAFHRNVEAPPNTIKGIAIFNHIITALSRRGRIVTPARFLGGISPVVGWREDRGRPVGAGLRVRIARRRGKGWNRNFDIVTGDQKIVLTDMIDPGDKGNGQMARFGQSRQGIPGLDLVEIWPGTEANWNEQGLLLKNIIWRSQIVGDLNRLLAGIVEYR